MNVLVVGGEALRRDLEAVLVRLRPHIEHAQEEGAVRRRLERAGLDLVVFDDDFFTAPKKRSALLSLLSRRKRPFVIVSSRRDPASMLEARRVGASDYILRPYNHRELIMRYHAVTQRKKRLVCIGGGSGLFTMLLGLKTLPNTLLVSIVNMSDDGGSSGKLSQAFGILPPGDIRRSLVALSNAPEIMNQIIQHRFDKGGDLHGHSFGNIFLTVLAEVVGSMSDAVKALSDILNIQGIVLPATRTLTKMVARFEDGTVVRGESRIDRGEGRRADLHIKRLWHEPEAECDAEAYAAVLFSEAVLIGPGDLYTSVITNLVVPDLRDALVRTKAERIYVCNIMTKPGETTGFDAADHVREVVKYLGRDCLDRVLVSDTRFSEESLAEYAKNGQEPVLPGHRKRLRKVTRAKVTLADLGNEAELVRHDSGKLREIVRRLLDLPRTGPG